VLFHDVITAYLGLDGAKQCKVRATASPSIFAFWLPNSSKCSVVNCSGRFCLFPSTRLCLKTRHRTGCWRHWIYTNKWCPIPCSGELRLRRGGCIHLRTLLCWCWCWCWCVVGRGKDGSVVVATYVVVDAVTSIVIVVNCVVVFRGNFCCHA